MASTLQWGSLPGDRCRGIVTGGSLPGVRCRGEEKRTCPGFFPVRGLKRRFGDRPGGPSPTGLGEQPSQSASDPGKITGKITRQVRLFWLQISLLEKKRDRPGGRIAVSVEGVSHREFGDAAHMIDQDIPEVRRSLRVNDHDI